MYRSLKLSWPLWEWNSRAPLLAMLEAPDRPYYSEPGAVQVRGTGGACSRPGRASHRKRLPWAPL